MAKPPASASDLALLFGGLKAPRAALTSFVDAYLRELPAMAGRASADPDPGAAPLLLPKNFLHAVLLGRMQVGPGDPLDPGQSADAAALVAMALPDASARLKFAQAALAAGLFDGSGSERAALVNRRKHAAKFAKLLSAEPVRHPVDPVQPYGQAQLQSGGLEVFVSPNETLPDPDQLAPALLLARQRLCRIESRGPDGKPVTGTGFLIGPSAVITNRHVVAHLIGQGDSKGLQALFDFSQSGGQQLAYKTAVPAHADWQIAVSDTGNLGWDAKPPGWENYDEQTGMGQPNPGTAEISWWADAALRGTWRTSLAAALDFAVIRLDGAPGLERGWYALDSNAERAPRGQCYVLHHPLTMGRSITFGYFHYADDLQTGQRLFHSASTEHGSSGGLVLDRHGVPVGLHYLGLGRNPLDAKFANKPPPVVPSEVINVAVPLPWIADALTQPERDHIAEPGVIAPLQGMINGHPVFGRQKLLNQVKALRDGTKRILYIDKPTFAVAKPGKTYSFDIVSSLLNDGKQICIRLEPDQVPFSAERLANLLVSQVTSDTVAELPGNESTQAENDKRLINFLRDTFAKKCPDFTIWLVLDSLDQNTITDLGGRNFLNELYKAVGTIPQLRVVLIGLSIQLPSLPPDQVADGSIEPRDVNNLGTLFADWLKLRGASNSKRPISPEVAQLMGKAMASIAGTATPLQALADSVSSHWSLALAEYFDT